MFTKFRGRLFDRSEQFVCAYGVGFVSKGWQATLVVESRESLKGREVGIRPCVRPKSDLLMTSEIGNEFQFDVPTESILAEKRTIRLDPLDDLHHLKPIEP